MAASTNDNEHSGLSQLSATEPALLTVPNAVDTEEGSREAGNPGESSKTIVANDTEKLFSTPSSHLNPSTPSVRPALVQLGSSTASQSSAAQPKRFSAMNINKKFLQKNSSPSVSSAMSQPSAKVGGPALRSPTQTLPSHSRLVTAKLTSNSPASSTSGAGWSRSSSVAPPNVTGTHSPNNSSPPLPTATLALNSTTLGTPQLPHVGKVIQPQPRSASSFQNVSSKDSSGPAKPVWGKIKSPATPYGFSVQNDFPTAAEVAQGASSVKAQKPNQTTETAENVPASKQTRKEEADAFRGVHLDPNAHHWDEMEEDDDNFLDSVIEFGDGRQYKIESTFAGTSSIANGDSPAAEVGATNLSNASLSKEEASHITVSKEERFADDFDRSWPRSSSSPATRDLSLPSGHAGVSHLQLASSLRPQQEVHSESARVLFNERSNRLEPYSSGPRSTSAQRKGSWRDSSQSPTDLRAVREIPPSPHTNNIQLLQKSRETTYRNRRPSNASTNGGGSNVRPTSTGVPPREKDHLTRRDGTAPAPGISKDNFVPTDEDKEPHNDRGRRYEMGPPPLPAHALRGSSREGGRQIPPHLSHTLVGASVRQDGKFSREARFSPQAETRVHLPPHSPALSHVSDIRTSPTALLTSLPHISAQEIDEARKDVMQTAAARAKQRRQQEEEEREKEKERARRKAAELDERIKAAAEAEKAAAQQKSDAEKLALKQEEEVIAVIEEAVNGVQTLKRSPEPTSSRTIRRPPSLKGLTLPDSGSTKAPRSSSLTSGKSHSFQLPKPPSSAVLGDSWRTKAEHRSPVPSFISPVEPLVLGSEEDLEVVDFMDMGKLIDAPTSEADGWLIAENKVSVPASRPVASDFFEDSDRNEPQFETSPLQSPKLAKSHQAASSLSIKKPIRNEQTPMSSRLDSSSTEHVAAPVSTTQTNSRSPRNQPFYKEATMSALNDAMSRIKGALDGMQAGEMSKDAPLDVNVSQNRGTSPARATTHKERWIPPALRSHQLDPERELLFHRTCPEPPQSPKPAWNSFVVKLPSVPSPFLDPISKKQLFAATRPPFPVRLDILSFEPPVEGMNKRDLSINDVLFHKPAGNFRTKPKYRVYLPKHTSRHRINGVTPNPPLKAASAASGFGKASDADEMLSWRRPIQAKEQESTALATNLTLVSPSDDKDSSNAVAKPVPEPTTGKADASSVARPRVPKMPAGSAVAIRRDSRIDAVEDEPHISVNFIVRSELESRQPSEAPVPSNQFSASLTPPDLATPGSEFAHNVSKPQLNGVKESIDVSSSVNKIDGKVSDDASTNSVAATPSIHSTSPWGLTSLPIPVKDSPARGPDPEHLRAVWSQTSNKAGISGVNSLEGIGDDLTALPFTLQDVKSEDGETPPPIVSAPPSRMSLHDVTKAFQQVPPSSSNPSPSRRTPPLTAPAGRPQTYAYSLPPPASTIRTSYPYPAPIMSPGPGVMYPSMMTTSPPPGRMPMNGHTPLYGPHMWMPVSAGSAPPSHTNMMRPMASPYSPHMVPYSPGPPMYGHQPSSMPNSTQPNGHQANRERSMPMLSPVLPPAGPMIYGSPVMMAALAPATQNHGYLVPPGRTQPRGDNTQIPQPSQQPHSSYNPTPFRPTW
ncbi:hypothetical protein H0H93_015897 [Arthromyces matolae]|nr:hypothetical protein H0H93_015897 [Arthromyces matolae]